MLGESRAMAGKVCGLISGGKDSNYAFYKALEEGYEPVCILSVRPERDDSWMFHTPYTSLVRLQAEAMGLVDIYNEHIVSGIKEEEVYELKKILAHLQEKTGFDTVSVGALASRYQYERVLRIANTLGFKVYAPYWKGDPTQYMRTLVSEGFRFIIVRITVYGLPESFLGREIGVREIEEIIKLSRRYSFHPAFEGGEAETLVIDAPHYTKRLKVIGKPRRLGPYDWIFEIENVKLVGKNLRE
jgi:diphthine-ammonia ligase